MGLFSPQKIYDAMEAMLTDQISEDEQHVAVDKYHWKRFRLDFCGVQCKGLC